MKRIILAPDSFKGTMSSIKICSIMEKEIEKQFPYAEIVKIPVADGGEGTVDCFLEALGGSRKTIRVRGPFFDEVDSFYGILPDNRTAVVEMAAAAGLPLAGDRKDPALTSTYGVGQLILDAMGNGCRRFILGLGGSCTNDGGAGMAAALGVKFHTEDSAEFIPVGGTLNRIARIDTSGIPRDLQECEFIGMCDVDNPLCGEYGASAVYGPQKGADPEVVKLLDHNLAYFSGVLRDQLNKDVASVAGSGAAGGLGAGILSFLSADLRSGINTVLDTVEFDALLEEADIVFTGEGRLDGQSLRGKVVLGVAERARVKNTPVIAVVGDIGDHIEEVYSRGVSAVVSINRVAVPFREAALRCEADLADTMDMILRLVRL